MQEDREKENNGEMKHIRILGRVMRQTGAYKIWIGFVAFVLVCSAIVWLAEPGIDSFGDGFWYCYAVVTTVGFGDVVATALVVRVLSVLMSIFAVVVIAILTGVVVNFYNHIIELRREDSLAAFLEKVDRLPEMSKEELQEVAERVRNFMKK